jgi:hypothetical protein
LLLEAEHLEEFPVAQPAEVAQEGFFKMLMVLSFQLAQALQQL